MIYFKAIDFPNQLTQPQFEVALRKAAFKKKIWLDFKKSVMDINRDKDFFGFEGKNTLYFTRTRTSLSFLLPKLIISLAKDESARGYKIRLSALPSAIALIIIFGVFVTLLSSINSQFNVEAFTLFFPALVLFVLAVLFEVRLVRATVAKNAGMAN